ncbi:MAG: [FeFe] hydrogenase H-cluster radical SAM maturase HydE [Candidatus Saganbacteria bacterium]|nr:[FeFe] hydrogenase H-cluster radical SAM maturase HydE [Candidatus Saganbacteria bacterium]
MCYAIPGKVIEIKDKIARIEYFGEQKQAINEIDELCVGDYIYAQGGYVIKLIPKPEAESILATWKETFFDLQEVDLRLSKMDLEESGLDRKLTVILDKAAEGIQLKEQELLYLLNLKDPKELGLLYKFANFLRQKHLKNSCCVHGIIEFSNYCSQGCAYCGISTHNKDINRYRMTKEEIYQAADIAINKYGFQALVLQSGEDSHYLVDDLCEIVSTIKKRWPCLIFASFGEVGLDGIGKLYKAGARGLLMRFESSNPEVYSKLHPGRDIKSRLAHLEAAYKLGYLIITGGLVGLPGQTNEDLLNDILLTRRLKTEMYTFGPFLPHPMTPLADTPPPLTKDILKVLAVARLADPVNAKILVTTGFETLDPKARELGLMAGANSVMLNVTPEKFSKNYTIYPNRAHSSENIQSQIETTLTLLRSIGRAPTDLGVAL